MCNGRQKIFLGRHFADEAILSCVRWYLRYSLSYRDVEELMAAWIIPAPRAGRRSTKHDRLIRSDAHDQKRAEGRRHRQVRFMDQFFGAGA